MTDTSGHIQFFGWQPTLGELITNLLWPLVAAILVALLVEPLRRWLSRTWNFLLDRISSLSDSRRAKRIEALELKVSNLKEYDDRKLLILFTRRIASLIVVFGFLIFISILTARVDFINGGIFAANLFGFGSSSFNETSSVQLYEEFIYDFLHGALFVLLLRTASLGIITFQEITDFSNPPKAIQRQEERINALRAKST